MELQQELPRGVGTPLPESALYDGNAVHTPQMLGGYNVYCTDGGYNNITTIHACSRGTVSVRYEEHRLTAQNQAFLFASFLRASAHHLPSVIGLDALCVRARRACTPVVR